MDTFQSKYIPKCIIWAVGGQTIFSFIIALLMLPMAQNMSDSHDPSPLLPIALIGNIASCVFAVVAEYVCIGKAMNECRTLPASPKRWFGIFTLVQLGMQVKEAVSRLINYRRLYSSLDQQLNRLPYSNEKQVTQDYMERFLAEFDKSVLISMAVCLVMIGLSYFVLMAGFQSYQKKFSHLRQ
ncbi:hypothetical protein [Ruminococcus sp.]|uniref:hypothetical protein n=1 Tax=Ruminococcus sp. TaxID=41978 RepID=UPI0025DD7FF6|nr:hypothetical protein [Ruminococcus sp.]MBQ8967948.1 hypothetical protein [Ruminococcus sp.]